MLPTYNQPRPPLGITLEFRSNTIAVVLVLLLMLSAVCLASGAESTTSLEAVAKKDGALRAALDAAERSEVQVRGEFERELAAVNKKRILALEQAFARASSKRDTETVAELAAVINKLKTGAATDAEDEEKLIGLVLNWSSNPGWGGMMTILAPSGAAWFVNMEDGVRQIQRFSWEPIGSNRIKWKTPHGEQTLTLDGESFYSSGKDRASGRVFRP